MLGFVVGGGGWPEKVEGVHDQGKDGREKRERFVEVLVKRAKKAIGKVVKARI